MIKVPKSLTVQIDTREKYPILFPATIQIGDPKHPDDATRRMLIPISTEKIKLNVGDYRLKEFPDCCVIERKASQRELFNNLMAAKGKIRQAKAFKRLADQVKYPYLLLEISPAEMLHARYPELVSVPEILFHRLCQVLMKYKFGLIWVSRTHTPTGRRRIGTSLIHLMLACALEGSEL